MSDFWRRPYIETELESLNSVEEIERSLGIDIVTLFRALAKGIYDLDNKTHYCVILQAPGMSGSWDLMIDPMYYLQYEPPADPDLGVHTHDYGKTWVIFGEQEKTKP